MQNEFDLIRALTAPFFSADPAIAIGNGDDCACLRVGDRQLLVSCDEQCENTHFRRDFPPRGLGRKLVASAASDILACGGLPRWLTLSIALAADLDESWVFALYEGVREACEEFGIALVGGNTTRSVRIHLSATVLGLTDRFVARSGAKKDDDLWLSAPLGESRLGLEALLRGESASRLCEGHLRVRLPIGLQPLIAEFATSAIDISDGFLGDIAHLMRSSKVGFAIENAAAIVAPKVLEAALNGRGITGESASANELQSAIEFALNSGEEYQLLFTAPPLARERFLSNGAILIGRAVADLTLSIDGKIRSNLCGFTHF